MALFRLLMGTHVENDSRGVERFYKQGDVFESKNNLLGLNGGGGMSPKFELIQQLYAPNTPPQPFVPLQKESQKPVEVVPLASVADDTSLPPQPHKPVQGEPITPIKSIYPSMEGKAIPKNKAEFVALLNTMSVKDLHSLVEDEDIDVDLKGLRNKEEMVKAIASCF